MAIYGIEQPATKEELEIIAHNPAYDHLIIGTIGSWRLYLNEDQAYMGRAYAWWRGPHQDLMSPMQLPAKDLVDFFTLVLPSYEEAVKYLFGATHVNLAWFGNETRLHRGHGHWHLIPRYFQETQRRFGGRTEPDDPRVGKNYAPHESRRMPPHCADSTVLLLNTRMGLNLKSTNAVPIESWEKQIASIPGGLL